MKSEIPQLIEVILSQLILSLANLDKRITRLCPFCADLCSIIVYFIANMDVV